MGGPCLVKTPPDSSWVRGPSCTDNFQLRKFVFDGTEYWSCEHAYQSHKFNPGPSRAALSAIAPHAGEKDSGHGMRVWSAGQRFLDVRPDWDAAKVRVMLDVNRAKYAQHADLRAQLAATGDTEFKGGPSTGWTFRGISHNWSRWNGVIQTIIREEIRESVDPGAAVDDAMRARRRAVLEQNLALIDSFFSSPEGAVPPTTADATAAAASASHPVGTA